MHHFVVKILPLGETAVSVGPSRRSYDVGNLDPGRTYTFDIIARSGPGLNNTYEFSEIETTSATTSKLYMVCFATYICNLHFPIIVYVFQISCTKQAHTWFLLVLEQNALSRSSYTLLRVLKYILDNHAYTNYSCYSK